MSKSVRLDSFGDVFDGVLESGGEVTFTVNGVSMTPLIKNGVDSVVIVKPFRPLKKYDIAFYRRKDGSFVLHRIVGKDSSGYILCGDGQTVKEHGITDEMMIGLATHIVKDGKRIDLYSPEMMSYAKKRVASIPYRHLKKRVSGLVNKVKKAN